MANKENTTTKIVDFTQLSEWGLIVKINKEVLHPLGLALTRDPDNGLSAGALVANDFEWQYSPEAVEVAEKNFEKFKKDRVSILTAVLGEDSEVTDG